MTNRSATGHRLRKPIDWQNFPNRDPISENELFPPPRKHAEIARAVALIPYPLTSLPRGAPVGSTDGNESSSSPDNTESEEESPPTSLDSTPSIRKRRAEYYYYGQDGQFKVSRKPAPCQMKPGYYYGRRGQFQIPRKPVPSGRIISLRPQNENLSAILDFRSGSQRSQPKNRHHNPAEADSAVLIHKQPLQAKRSPGRFVEGDVDGGPPTPLTITPHGSLVKKHRPLTEHSQMPTPSSKPTRPTARTLISSAQTKLQVIRGKAENLRWLG